MVYNNVSMSSSKVLIGIPARDTVYQYTYNSLFQLDTDGIDTAIHHSVGYGIAQSRNKLADYVLSNGFTHILYVDNDVVLPKDALKNLLEHQKQAVFGYYARRSKKGIYEGFVSVYKLGESSYTGKYSAEELKQKREQGEHLLRIHGGGMGCALIESSAFKSLEFPYFKYIEYPTSKRSVLGEDLYFCNQLKSAKIPIYVDTRVGCGHVFRYVQEVM